MEGQVIVFQIADDGQCDCAVISTWLVFDETYKWRQGLGPCATSRSRRRRLQESTVSTIPSLIVVAITHSEFSVTFRGETFLIESLGEA